MVKPFPNPHLFHPEIERSPDNGRVNDGVGQVLADLLELFEPGHTRQRYARQEYRDL